MNLIFIADIVPYPPNTGIKIRTYNIIKQLAERGNEVHLLAFNHKTFLKSESEKQACITELKKFCKDVRVFEIPSERNKFTRFALYIRNLFSPEPYRVQRYYSGECISAIKEIISKENIHLCHLDKTEFYKYRCFLGSMPVFATNHNVESDLMRQRASKEVGVTRKLFALLQWLKTERYEQLALNGADGYITCSDIDAEFFKSKYGLKKPYAVIHNGVDCDYYMPRTLPSGPKYFLIIGAQNKESTANYDATKFFLEEIWPIARKSEPSINVRIVGRNPDPCIVEFARQDKQIQVLGYVEDERDVFAKAHALLVPLRIGGGSRLKILTAFGLGKAVISTTKGAEGISCTDGKDILIGDSAPEFARHMVDIWRSSEKTGALGRASRQLAEDHYDWKIIGRNLVEFYQSNTLRN